MLEPGSKDHEQNRNTVRVVGIIVLVIGGMMFLRGISIFFSPFSTNPLTFIWAVLGLPIAGIGMQLLTVGYLGKIARYQANEIAPVGKDALEYMAKGAKGSVHEIARALGAGLRGEDMNTAPVTRTCHQCGNKVIADDRFCDQCGSSMTEPSTCPACHAAHDADARFCPACGKNLPNS